MTLPSNFYGGWSLIADTCPGDTTACGDRSCCPTGATCDTFGSTYSNLCCPGQNDCSNAVKSLPTCANTTWTLYNTIKDPICCLPGQIALQPQGSSLEGSCVDAEASFPASLIAPKASGGASNASSGSAKTSTASGNNRSTSASTATATPSHTASASAHSKPELPVRTIAGIAVGAAVILLFALALCCILARRRKNKRRLMQPAQGPPINYGPYGPNNGMARSEVQYAPYNYAGPPKGESYMLDGNVRSVETVDQKGMRHGEARELLS